VRFHACAVGEFRSFSSTLKRLKKPENTIVDGENKKTAFSNVSGLMWTKPKGTSQMCSAGGVSEKQTEKHYFRLNTHR